MLRRFLLACGIAASLVYIATDVLAAIRYPAYHSFSSRVISELMASGAPTERFVDPLFLFYGVLMLAFSVGIWLSAPDWRMRLTAILWFGFSTVGFLGPTLFEMNVRGSGGDPMADVLHIAVTMVLSVLTIAAMLAGASTRGRWFRRYTYASLALMFVFGGLTAIASQNLGKGPTPWIGLVERVNIWASMLWIAVFAVSFARTAGGSVTSSTSPSRLQSPSVSTR